MEANLRIAKRKFTIFSAVDMMEEGISEELRQAAAYPKRRGAIFQIEANNKGLALVDAKSGSLKIYAMIDPGSDAVLDAKFFTYGGPLLTALADILCEEIIGKKIDEIQTLDLESLFSRFGAGKESEEFQALAKLPAIIAEAYPEKKSIALAALAAMGSAKLKAHTAEGRASADAEWNALSDQEKLARVEECLNDKVRAMLAGDGGGMEVLGIKDGKRVVIRYQGACAYCGAAGGGTLYYIEEQLQENVYYGLSAEPEIPNMLEPEGLQ